MDTATNSGTVQLPAQGLQLTSSAPNMKTDDSDVLWGVIPANDRPFNYFLTKYYAFPDVSPLKSLRVAITNVEMDVNNLFNASCAISEEKQLLPQMRHSSYRATGFSLP